MADWNGFKKNGETYIPNDATARASISVIEGKIPNGTTSSNPLVNQSTMENALDGKADVGDVTSLAESVSAIEDKIPSNASSSNQLATRSEVSAAYKPKGNATLATLPPLTNTNLNNVYNMTEDFTTTADFAEGAGIEVKAGNEVGIINIATDPDARVIKYTVLGGFIDLSEYATQASVTSALADKVDKVTGKGLSTNDYDNTAKGIVDNIQSNVIANTKLIKDTVGWSGKNKLPNNAVSRTLNGIVWEVYSDGHVRAVSGTSTSDSNLTLSNTEDFGNSHLTTYGTPTANGYTISDGRNDDSATTHFMAYDKNSHAVYIGIKSGQTVSNLDFYPMIRPANILDDTYEPYFGSTAFPRSEQAVLGAKNLLEAPIINRTINGVTYSIAKDGTVSLSGTSTETFWFKLSYVKNLKDGEQYIFSGVDPIPNKLSVYLHTSNPEVSCSVAGTRFTKSASGESIMIKTYSGQNYDGISFKLMIRLADDPDNTYEPHAMTNRELTDTALDFVEAGTHTNVTDVNVKCVRVGDSRIISIFARITAAVSDYVTIGTIYGIPLVAPIIYPYQNAESRVYIGSSGDIRVYSQSASTVNFTIIV